MGSIDELVEEGIGSRKECGLCGEASIPVGEKTGYGAGVIFKIGNGLQNGWLATLSPKTGGNPKEDFSIQLMPFGHLTHFAQLSKYPELAKNYGIAFAKLSNAIAAVMAEENPAFKATVEERALGTSIATYGKCTNWSEKKEHLHLKVFPFRAAIGQPYTVDSSFGKKKVFKDETGKGFVKMEPVKKVLIPKERFEELSKKLIGILGAGEK